MPCPKQNSPSADMETETATPLAAAFTSQFGTKSQHFHLGKVKAIS